ncbi:MAG TPA: hypothetical protein PKW55_06795 [Spirochaetota bacterium]|nr:hypothetical protein [Spirochaetota bacterium]HOM38778.1 hypothetical protein [Spirochaetota bacterium]HPQ49576.1 hypothetical protein [Spirochaetota bacterium]
MIINCVDKISKNTEVILEGWVSRFLWFNFSIKNEELEIYHNNTKISEVRTDVNGRFYTTYNFEKPGLYSLKVKLKKYDTEPGILNVLIISPEKKNQLVVCDIDNTIVNFSYMLFIFGLGLTPINGARNVLKEISEKYYILYLTHRHDMFTNTTKEWIISNDFPIAPVFLWSMKYDPFKSYSYKVKKIRDLVKETGLEIIAGIGDRESDIMAYKKVGINKIFLIDSNQSWEKIRKELL